MTRPIGVCSWSLQPRSSEQLVERVEATGLRAVQLALEPIRQGLLDLDTLRGLLAGAGITVLSGMMETKDEDYSTLESIRRTGGIVPDHTWKDNVGRARQVADLAHRLEISLVTFHAGFIPHDPGDASGPKLIGRVQLLADLFAAEGIQLGLETGQETATTLLATLVAIDRANVVVNFDPANLILYGKGDPVAALPVLVPFIHQVHVKDARPAMIEGAWGTEVIVGEGAVEWDRLFDVLNHHLPDVPLVFEREAGVARVQDIQHGFEFVRPFLPNADSVRP